jgi:hypothetical protein
LPKDVCTTNFLEQPLNEWQMMMFLQWSLCIRNCDDAGAASAIGTTIFGSERLGDY